MKKRALLFVFFALLMLSIVPIVNLSLGNLRNTPMERWGSRAALYNVDFALPHVNRLFYSLGISTSPGKVVIGKSDWLYLGDDYENALSVMRNGATADDADTTSEIGVATKAWAEWFKLKNVRLFKVMIGPDKGTIYPEFLPDWVQPATHSATDMLIANTNPEIFLDTAAVLRNKKNQFSQPLYYRTDTHWNDLGAWIAFGALAADVARTEQDLTWHSAHDVHISKVDERPGGDLSRFLRMDTILRDTEVTIELGGGRVVETEQSDFVTGNPWPTNERHQVGTPARPLLVKSKNALNKKRVLWLRDSFGDAIAPYMAATFSESLQLNYGRITAEELAKLVVAYKPDFVFVTVAERLARNKWFTILPPRVPAAG